MINWTVNLIFFNKKNFQNAQFPRYCNNAQVTSHLGRMVTMAGKQQFHKKEDEDISLISRIKKKDNNNCNF